MILVELYVCFNHRRSIAAALRERDPISTLTHVEAFGITVDQTWFFIDPNRFRTDLMITHRHDEVAAQIEVVCARSRLVLRVEQQHGSRIPAMGPITCASQIGHLCGVRAFTPRALERRLRAIGAQEVPHAYTQGRSR